MNLNAIYQVARELYRKNWSADAIEAELLQRIEEMKENPDHAADVNEYNARYGIQQYTDWNGRRITKVDHAGLEKVIITQYTDIDRMPGQLGNIQMLGERVRHPMLSWIITTENRMKVLDSLLDENFLSKNERETVLLAFLELAATSIDDLVYLVYGSEVIDPAQRRKLFMMAAAYMKENKSLYDDDIEYLQAIEGDITPKEEIINGFVRLRLELPHGFYMTLGDYGRAKEHTGPKDNIIHLQINYWNPKFPRVFDRSIERGFCMDELQALKEIIHSEKQLDSVAEGYFMEFVDRIKRHYKYK